MVIQSLYFSPDHQYWQEKKGKKHTLSLFSLSLVPSSPPFVSLEASQQSVRGGDNITVSCTVLGEPEADVTFNWTYPGQVGATASRERLFSAVLRNKMITFDLKFEN